MDKSINKNFDYIKQLLVNIPEKPGVYEYFDESEKILYVGKARNLKRRVSSYFSHFNDLSPKIRILVRKICNIKYIVLENEIDAFVAKIKAPLSARRNYEPLQYLPKKM